MPIRARSNVSIFNFVFHFSEKHESNLRPALHKVRINHFLCVIKLKFFMPTSLCMQK